MKKIVMIACAVLTMLSVSSCKSKLEKQAEAYIEARKSGDMKTFEEIDAWVQSLSAEEKAEFLKIYEEKVK